jgi:hypothetical protein
VGGISLGLIDTDVFILIKQTVMVGVRSFLVLALTTVTVTPGQRSGCHFVSALQSWFSFSSHKKLLFIVVTVISTEGLDSLKDFCLPNYIY